MLHRVMWVVFRWIHGPLISDSNPHDSELSKVKCLDWYDQINSDWPLLTVHQAHIRSIIVQFFIGDNKNAGIKYLHMSNQALFNPL